MTPDQENVSDRLIIYPKITYLKPPSKSVKPKGSFKEVKPTQYENSMKWSPSYFEHVDSHFPKSPTLKSQKSVYKGVRISKPPLSPLMPKITYIKGMPLFMHKHI